MKLKWQWFLGGRIMFWVSIILFIVLVFGFVITYIIDPTTCLNMKVQNVDETSIREISEDYVKSLGITVNKPIVYRFVKYNYDKGYEAKLNNTILLGTFHEWNGKYYIDISVDLYKMYTLKEIVIHETRHMLVEYLKDENIIDLDRYSEEIAQEKNNFCNEIFNNSIELLKSKNHNDIKEYKDCIKK